MELPNLVTPEFKALSAMLGSDPLQVQGPGGNTSIKDGSVMYIKASGTELAEAESKNIFVAVDRDAAVLEAFEKAGDGSCKDTVLDTSHGLRPSIETTFHAAFDHRVVAHTHSVATIAHAISPEGRKEATSKLAGLNFVMVPYAKPGLPLTRKILARIKPETQVVVLQNHGLICAGDSVEEVKALIADVEKRLALPPRSTDAKPATAAAPKGFSWSDYGWLAQDDTAFARAKSGTYYPDHVVFLGPCLPTSDHDGNPPAILQEGQGVLIKDNATPVQIAMLACVSDVLSRVQDGWGVDPIGPEAEAELLDWDAEKYRQALAARA
jgi:rhamnose utilization protein RhaD (predicted bifunctional aldolase and dehydrogenase)